MWFFKKIICTVTVLDINTSVVLVAQWSSFSLDETKTCVHDSCGAQHPLPLSSHPLDKIYPVLQHMCDCSGAQHPLPVSADIRDDNINYVAAYV
jgi:hypothetical protein